MLALGVYGVLAVGACDNDFLDLVFWVFTAGPKLRRFGDEDALIVPRPGPRGVRTDMVSCYLSLYKKLEQLQVYTVYSVD